MKHLSEFVSTSKDLYRIGQVLAVNLYFYLPLNKTVVFFRRKGELLVEEDLQKIRTLPKNTLLIHRSDSGKSIEMVSNDLSKKITASDFTDPETQAGVAALLNSISVVDLFEEGPSRNAAVQALMGVQQTVEQVITKLEKTPSVKLYEKTLNDSKRKGQTPIEMHHSQVSGVAILMLLTAAGDPVIGKGMVVNGDTLARLGVAGLVHDLGLINTPKLIVERHLTGDDDELTVSEKLIYMRHVDKSLALLKESKAGMSEETLRIVEFHHENYNGTGFRGMAGNDIPLGARILRIADDLVACINHPGNLFGFKEALAHVALRDRHLVSPIYDPDLMNALATIQG